MPWIKYDYLCTECDTLIEITSYLKVDVPKCPCSHQAVIRINKHTPPITSPDVTSITPPKVVKINTNPYN